MAEKTKRVTVTVEFVMDIPESVDPQDICTTLSGGHLSFDDYPEGEWTTDGGGVLAYNTAKVEETPNA